MNRSNMYILAVCALCSPLVAPTRLVATEINPNDILVLGSLVLDEAFTTYEGAVARIDRSTGKFELIARGNWLTGSGDIAVGPAKEIYVLDRFYKTVVQIGPNGLQSSLAQFGRSSAPRGLTVAADGMIYVSDYALDRVYQIDPVNGITDSYYVDNPHAVAAASNGTIYVSSNSPVGAMIVRLDPATGSAQPVAYGMFDNPVDMVETLDGSLAVLDQDAEAWIDWPQETFERRGAVIVVDPTLPLGSNAIVASSEGYFHIAGGIGRENNGQVLVANGLPTYGTNGLIRIDLDLPNTPPGANQTLAPPPFDLALHWGSVAVVPGLPIWQYKPAIQTTWRSTTFSLKW